MSFQQFSLHPQVLAGVQDVGFTTPTPIQLQAIPVTMEGRDVMGLAQTGTGKTAAFVLPILHHLATTPAKRGIRYLVIAPTRELAEQIHQTFVDLGQHVRIKSVSIYGGVAKGPQLSRVRRGAQVVIACPGRLLDHVTASLTTANLEVGARIAGPPEMIKGFGHVKAAAIEKAMIEEQKLLKEFDTIVDPPVKNLRVYA